MMRYSYLVIVLLFLPFVFLAQRDSTNVIVNQFIDSLENSGVQKILNIKYGVGYIDKCTTDKFYVVWEQDSSTGIAQFHCSQRDTVIYQKLAELFLFFEENVDSISKQKVKPFSPEENAIIMPSHYFQFRCTTRGNLKSVHNSFSFFGLREFDPRKKSIQNINFEYNKAVYVVMWEKMIWQELVKAGLEKER